MKEFVQKSINSINIYLLFYSQIFTSLFPFESSQARNIPILFTINLRSTTLDIYLLKTIAIFPSLSTPIIPPSSGSNFYCLILVFFTSFTLKTTSEAASCKDNPLYSINAAISCPTQYLAIKHFSFAQLPYHLFTCSSSRYCAYFIGIVARSNQRTIANSSRHFIRHASSRSSCDQCAKLV